jgi:DNA-binding response OmpR family regulator
MVVDDDVMNREVMEAFLTFEHFQVILANNGHRALECLNQDMPNLIILDLRMPDMNGAEVCRIIKSRFSIPVFIITGMDSPQERAECKAAGADEFIPRPFEVDMLISRIKMYLSI